jgi:hypothetical protein
MATLVNYTLPIYQAVVCNLALEKMRLEEEQEKLLSAVLQSLGLSKELFKLLSEADLSTASREEIEQGYVALSVLVDAGRRAATGVRAFLPSISEKYRFALATAVDDMEANNDHFEEICEAWGMASDETLVADIKNAVSASSNKNGKETPDWREALASFSN